VNKKMRKLFQKLFHRKLNWVNWENVVFVVVIIAFIVIVVWSEPLSMFIQNRNQLPDDVQLTRTTLPGTPTPLPEEFLTSAQQTNGVISGAVIILVAIIAGTAAILIREREK